MTDASPQKPKSITINFSLNFPHQWIIKKCLKLQLPRKAPWTIHLLKYPNFNLKMNKKSYLASSTYQLMRHLKKTKNWQQKGKKAKFTSLMVLLNLYPAQLISIWLNKNAFILWLALPTFLAALKARIKIRPKKRKNQNST